MAGNVFADAVPIGTFKGFTEAGLEFAADIVVPYLSDDSLTPRSGQLLLVQLSTPEEALLGRITRFVPVGAMASFEGDEYLASMSRMSRPVPEQLKEDRLRYSVRVKLLGGIRTGADGSPFTFVPSVRKLPHLGAPVAYPSTPMLRFLCRLGAKDAKRDTPIGYYALGDVIYGPSSGSAEDFFLSMPDELEVHFDIASLVGKRTFVFARAGYGKSNLMKLLIAELYRQQPTITMRGEERPVGTLIFDPEGEYFWPDEHGRPGLCDVSHLRSRVAVFTNRAAPNPHYASWKAGDVRLDLRLCPPADIVRLCLSGERQEQQNVIKIRTISTANWRALIDLLHDQNYNASENDIRNATGIAALQDVECVAMRSNLVPIIRTLHDPESGLLRAVQQMLREGRVVVIDVSLVSGRIALQVAGLLLNRIFDNNQASFTDPDGAKLIPALAVLEEAQSVLGGSAADDSPFVQWTKEGRKYSLGAILVTQQPGSIAPELLSQGDNFFSFHLLSAHDLKTLQFHNAHFSDDVLAHLLNEPIRGNVFFWSAPHQPFVLPARVRNFEHEYRPSMPSPAELALSVDTGISSVMSSEQAMILRVALKARERLLSGDIKLEALEGNPDFCVAYKPNLAADLGKQMTAEERREHCGGGPDGATYVNDTTLDKILASTGIWDGSPERVKGRRPNGRDGDFYKILRGALLPQANVSGTVTPVK